MKIVVFGLSVSFSWGNGHATLWRGLCRAFARRGHRIVFFERDQPFYATTRDLHELPGLVLVLYRTWDEGKERAASELQGADVGVLTSFCPDACTGADLVLSSNAQVRCYYDLDTPVTLAMLDRGEAVPYLPQQGLCEFDVVLSYTGGRALDLLRSRLGARRCLPLYGFVDPEHYRPAPPRREFMADLSYFGTCSQDRQAALVELFLEVAEARRDGVFVIAGAQYPSDFPWRSNVRFVRHLPPGDHPAFFASARATLNVTRGPMPALGYCASPRFFEAAACGIPTISDVWEGIEQFLEPGEELLLARSRDDVLAALDLEPSQLARIGRRARERVLEEHTADHRALELERALFGG